MRIFTHHFRVLLAGTILAGFWSGTIHGQTVLNFQESPAGSGLLVAQDSDAYTATGQGNGIQYLLNGEGGDRLTVLVQTDLGVGSTPRIRLADGDNAQLALVTGSSGGRVALSSYTLPAPGVYRVTIFSDTNASPYDLQAMIGRGVALETENNNRLTLADETAPNSQPGGFELRSAGVLEYNPDFYDLGELAAGNSINASLQLPNGSSLNANGVELSLFKEGDTTPTTSVLGGSLVETIAESARYFVRVSTPGVAGLHGCFDGNDSANAGDPASLRITGSQTIEMWIRPEHFARRQNPVAKAWGGEGTLTMETNGTINYYYGIGGGNNGNFQGVGTGVALPARAWTHIALVRDLDSAAKTITWYINGRQTAQAAAQYFPAVASSLDFLIGTGYTNGFDGKLDEIRIWNVARSQQQISDNLGTTLTGNETGLVSYYKIDEGSGGTLTDSGPSGNDATIDGDPTWEGNAGALPAAAASQGTRGTYLFEVDVTDAIAPGVTEFQPTPVAGYIFDGTTGAPTHVLSQRGNNDTSFLYTLTGTTSGSTWGTDTYTDDSPLAKSAVHAGVLRPGELGSVRVTIKPGEDYYLSTARHGTTSTGFGAYGGSYIIERYDPPAGFTLDGLYQSFWVAFSEPLDTDTLSGAVDLLGAGPNNTFGDGDDLTFTVNLVEFTHDNRGRFNLGGATLPPGMYRLTVAGSVEDRAGNTLGTAYQEDFTILGETLDSASYINESGLNDSFGTADTLSLDVMSETHDGSFLWSGIQRASVGSHPFDNELADFDGDGNLDLAVVHHHGGSGLRIFPGNGDGTFGEPLTFPQGTHCDDVELIDIDNDNDTDLAITVRTDRVVIFRNDSTVGNLAFVELPFVAVGDDPRRIRSGLINNDNYPDLVVSNYGTNGTTGRSVSILLNDQSGGFTEAKAGLTLSPRVRAHGIALGLLNNDAHLDLVVGDYDSNHRIAVFLGNGDGTFNDPVNYYDFPSTYSPIDISIADFDQDGNLDACVAANNGGAQRIYLYPGNGDGTFGDVVDHHFGRGADLNFVKTLDLDGDGATDILTGDGSRLYQLQNRNEGSFAFHQRAWSLNATYGISAGDVNGDGRYDIVASIYHHHLIRTLLGNAKGLLADDDSAEGILHGYGRGFLSNANDNDYYQFSAVAGQRLTVAVDNTSFGGSNRYSRFILYNSEGAQISDNYMSSSNNRAGQSAPYTIPRNGTYFIRFLNWGNYFGEYRFRVSLSPEGVPVESENNDSIGNADGVSFVLNGNQLSRQMFGYAGVYDTNGDYYNLGNLAPGTRIDLDLSLPSTSSLVTDLRIYKAGGAEVTPDNVTATHLDFTLQAGDEGTYYARVLGTDGRGLLGEYLIDFLLTDTVPPTIVGDTLPAEGSTLTFQGSNFNLTFSEDMLASTVNDAANYELLGSGGDGTFNDGNEEVFTVQPGSYSSGLSNSYHVPDGPFQPDTYRFRAQIGLKDKLNNPLANLYERTWTIEGVPGYILESRNNDGFSTADTLSLDVMPGVFDGSFLNSTITRGSVGNHPFDLELADFDGDGNADAAVGYHHAGRGLRVFPGNGDGSFGDPVSFVLGTHCDDVELFDLDNDNDTDVAITVRNDQVVIFQNDSTPGNLSFTQLPAITVGDDPRRIATGLINNDNYVDLVVTNYGTNATTGRCISVLINDQAGGFTETKIGTALSSRMRPIGIELGLLNADAHLDIVVGDWDSGDQVGVMLGNGDGTFADPTFYDFPTDWGPSDIALADYNQDGNIDAAVSAHSGSAQRVYFYPGNGDGTFGDRLEHHLNRGADLNFIKASDLNGDGAPDLVTGDGSRLYQLSNRNDGTFTFDQHTWSQNATYAFDTGDVNGDGLSDLALAIYHHHQLRVLLGNAKSLLQDDDSATGVLHAYGRGHLTGASDNDYFSFSAQRGQRLTVAVDNTIFGAGNRYTRFILYNSHGAQISDNYMGNSGNRAGQSAPYTIPRDGTYYIRFLNWGNYFDEYRFRVSLSPEGVPLESENNDSVNNADGVSLLEDANGLSRQMFGYVGVYDTNGDYYNLGNLAAGARIDVDITLPSTSTLTTELRLYKGGGVLVTPDNVTPTHLDFTLQPGDESTYYVRVLGTAGRGILAEYFVNMAISDNVPPTIVSDTLPAEGSSLTFFGSNFNLGFSEDMLFTTVRDAENYELLASGGDGTFDDGNEVVYPVQPASYSSGLSNSYHIPVGPMQPDHYRFRAQVGLQDKLGNNLAAIYERTWTIDAVSGFVLEGLDNNGFSTADTVSLDVMPTVFDGTFQNAAITRGSTGTHPFDLELADFDGDGNLDAAVGYHHGGRGLRVFPGNGDGTFGDPLSFVLGTHCDDVELFDLDNDNDTDVAITVRSDQVVIFRNDSTPGNIAFTQLPAIAVGDDPRRIATGLINNDDYVDLVVTNYGSNATQGRSVSVLLNDQAGGFTESKVGTALSPRVRPIGVALGRLDGDDHLDLVVGDIDSDDQIVVWRGNGDGTFGAPAYYNFPTNWEPFDISLADFDQDGNLDAGVAAHSGSARRVYFYPGNGDGTFGDYLEHDLGRGADLNFIKTPDLNGDSWPDVLTGDGSRFFQLTNRAEGGTRFVQATRSQNATYGFDAGDVNNDGRVDLVLAIYHHHQLRVLLGNAKSLLQPDPTLPGLTYGHARGSLTSASDNDYFSFSAIRGQRLTVAVDNTPLGGGNRYTRFLLYNAEGGQISDNYMGNSGNRAGQSAPYTIPRDGTYYIRFANWGNYFGEYRYRVTLSPADAPLESENNDSRGNADGVNFDLVGNQRIGKKFGYVGVYDTSGDFYNLGNLAQGTEINLNLTLPKMSTLVPILEIFDGAGTQRAAGNPGDTSLSFTLSEGDDSTYYARVRASAGLGLDAQYQLEASLTDLLPPEIVGHTLPNGTVGTLVENFNLSFNKDLLASSVRDAANYTLISAGADNLFSTPDDVVYPIAPGNYAGGLSASFSISGSPLQPGIYELRAFNLQDTFGNPLPVAFEHQFTVSQVSGHQTEQEANGSVATATPLVFNTDVGGLLNAAGRGRLANSSDRDYWSFDAEGGDVLIFEPFIPGINANHGLRWHLTDPDGSVVFDRYVGGTNYIETQPAINLTKTGKYTFFVAPWHGIYTEYRVRVTLLRDLQNETENNDDLPSANVLSFSTENNISGADVAGFLGRNTELDYFDLGQISAGHTVFLSVTYPDGSTLIPIVGIYNDGGLLQNEVNGAAGDDNAEVQISANGNYYALIRPNLTSAGIMSQYVLNVRVLPTNAVNFPNLRVTSVSNPPANGTESGDLVTLTYEVTNSGNLATGAAAWSDRIVLSQNDAFGDLDDLQLALVPRNGALDPGQSYTVNHQVRIPDGLFGDFYVFIETDSSNAVDEILQEGDNTGRSGDRFNVALRNYPDLVIENLTIVGPDANNDYAISWDLANRGTGIAPTGSKVNLEVLNTTTGQTLANLELQSSGPLSQDQTESQNESVRATDPGFYVVTVTADPQGDLYEYGAGGHALAEQNSVQDNFQIFRFFEITLAAAPGAGGSVAGAGTYREGEMITVQATPNTLVLPYAFINWTENGSFVSASPTYKFTAGADRNLVAVFALPQFQITANASPANGGSISGTGTYALDSVANLTANPSAGYLFDRWEENGSNIGGNPVLNFSVTGSRTLTAIFTEATPEHVVTFTTDPAGIATIAGAGTYPNGNTLNISAPSPVEQGDFEYLFKHWTLNGLFVTNSPSFDKTFTTLDPANMAYTAVYEQRSLKPKVVSVTTNYGTLVPRTDDVVFTVRFDREMKQTVNPALDLISATAPAVPAIPGGGSWVNTTTFQSMPTSFGPNNGGGYTLTISGGTDSADRVMDADNSFGFTVDALPPVNPAIVESATSPTSVTVSWNGYDAPVDLSGFRYFISTTNYTDVSALAAVSGGNSNARQFEFKNLTPDQEYFVSVVAIDVAGNSDPNVTTLRIIRESDVPPPVNFALNNTSLTSTTADWSVYDSTALVGLDGFRIFVETAPFTNVSALTPMADVEEGITSYDLEGLDRNVTYYVAVVGYNVLDEINPEVTPLMWTDPLSGAISSGLTIGGRDQTINILNSATIEDGADLTIAPGTTLSFAPGTSLQVNDGRLLAHGTDLDPIHFTSAREFDELNHPARGDWNGLILADPIRQSELSHVWVRYGRGLQVQAGNPQLDGIYAVQNQLGGLVMSGTGLVNTSHCYFVFNENGVHSSGASNLTISDSVIKSNTEFNVDQNGTAAVDASGNWWGTPSESAIANRLDGAILANTPLTEEPVLGAAFATSTRETQTGSQTVELRLMTVNAIAARLSEDSQFNGVLFNDLYLADETFRIGPYGFAQDFTLSSGAGLKSIFLQFNSDSDQTSDVLRLDIEFITDGPVIEAFSITEGEVISRPLQVSARATAALGLKEIDFLVDGSLEARTNRSPLGFLWDPRGLNPGIVRVEALARDHAGKTATRSLNVVVEPTPPPAPIVTTPAHGIVVATNTISVTGTAEPGISLRIYRNGSVVGDTTDADVNGNFTFTNVPLEEGPNNLVVATFDQVGSTSAVPRTIFLDSGPPAGLELNELVYNPVLRRISFSWFFMEEGERPTTFQIFWNETAFSDPADASGQGPVTDQMFQALTTVPDGAFHFGVIGYDDAGNRSAISNLRQFSVDRQKPTLTISYGSGIPVGPGNLGITITTSEPLIAPPILTIRPNGLQSIGVPLTGGPTHYTADYTVSDLSARSGTARVTVSGTDLAGNFFVGTPEGPALEFDLTRPTGILAFDSDPPIRTTSPTLLSIGLVLSEPAAPGTVPSLILDPPVGDNVPVNLSGSGTNWNGSVTLTPAMGKGEAFFLLNVKDLAGNTGTVIRDGDVIEIYNTEHPDPPGIPVGLVAETLSGGRVAINWSPAERAESYTVRREPGLEGGTPAIVIAEDVPNPTFIDTPPADGFYRYAIVANLRGVSGDPSGVLEAFSDRTPPEAPENVQANLLARGVEIDFDAPAGGEGPAAYYVYRGNHLVRQVSTPQVVADSPPRGSFDYAVASVDQYGNENRSPGIQIDLLVSPVQNFQVLLKEGEPNSLIWQSTDNTVTGFNVYRDGVKQNGAPLTESFYVDPLATGLAAVSYEVSALNANGDESPRRLLRAFPVALSLTVNPNEAGDPQASRVNYFDRYSLMVNNRAGTGSGDVPLSTYEINRTVGGEDATMQSGNLPLSIGPGLMGTQEIIIPSPSNRAAPQVIQVLAKSPTDGSGSFVSYENVFEAAHPVDLGTNVLLSPHEPPLAGGLTNFDVTVYNNGYAPIDVILGRANGAEPGDLSIVVLDANGLEVARTPFKGQGVGGISIANGNLFKTLAPGDHFVITVPGVFVPSVLADAGENTVFRAEVSSISHDIISGSPTLSGPLAGSTRSNLTETPYYGTAHTDQVGYNNNDVVTITGQAIDRESGQPVPNADLRLGFGARGIVVYEEITTDENGNYTFDYTPPVGFSGALNIWGAHPLIVDQLNQVTIEYLRLYVTPQSAEIIMSENDFLDFNLELINPGELHLTQIEPTARVYVIDGENEVEIDSIRLEQPGGPVDAAPNGRTRAPLRLVADLAAPRDAFMEVVFRSQEGAAVLFTSTIGLRPAVPVLSVKEPSVSYVDLSVSRGDLNSQVVVLENLGLRPLEGVEMIPPQNIPWMQVNLPTEADGRILLPDVPVGGRLAFTVVYTPPPGAELGFYDDHLLIRGSNAIADFQLNLFAQVTSNETGSLKFALDNIFVEPVPNAKIRLRNPNLREDLGPFFTDANGEVTIPDLQEGLWSWKATSAGHTSLTGTVNVLANQTTLVEERFSKSLVTVEFSVVPVPFTDRYTITIEQTFETRVPFPVLVLNPPSLNFNDLPDEFEATVLVKMKNEGLVRMFDCTVDGSAQANASFLPLITYFPELLPQQEVVVPFKFRFDADGLAKLRAGESLAISASFGNAVSDCFGAVFDPTDFLNGLFALAARARGAASCLDGSPAFANADLVVMFAGGFALGASLADPIVSIAQFIGCVAGTLLGLGDGGGAPGGSGGPTSGGAPFSGPPCFPAGTLVTLPDYSTIPIEQLTEGQEILTSHIHAGVGKVNDMMVRKSEDVLELVAKPALKGQDLPDITLKITGDHIVWSDRRGWTAARNLEIGEWLHNDKGHLYELVSRKAVEGEHTVYTIDIDGDNAFFANRILVQDLCGHQRAEDQSLFRRSKGDKPKLEAPVAQPATK